MATDLLGDPIDPNHGRKGRPRHVATASRREHVRQLQDAGHSQPIIAAALGITIPTLLRHYHRELGSTSQLWRQRDGQNLEKGTNNEIER